MLLPSSLADAGQDFKFRLIDEAALAEWFLILRIIALHLTFDGTLESRLGQVRVSPSMSDRVSEPLLPSVQNGGLDLGSFHRAYLALDSTCEVVMKLCSRDAPVNLKPFINCRRLPDLIEVVDAEPVLIVDKLLDTNS